MTTTAIRPSNGVASSKKTVCRARWRMSVSPVTVVIPTYNCAGFIKRTLESVFSQTCPPAEIIVVDDASRDGTRQIVSEIAAEARVPVRLIALPTNSGGPAVPQNHGVELANTELIATLDQDDLFTPNKLERVVRCFESNPRLGLIFHDAIFFDENGVFSESAPSFKKHRANFDLHLGDGLYTAQAVQMRRILADANLAGCSSMVFRKVVWASIAGFDPRIRSSCDYEFMIKACRDHAMAALPEALARCRRHSSNLSQSAMAYNDEENVIIRQKVYATASDPIERTILRQQIYKHLLNSAYAFSCQGRFGASALRYIRAARYGNPFRPCWLLMKATIKKLIGHRREMPQPRQPH